MQRHILTTISTLAHPPFPPPHHQPHRHDEYYHAPPYKQCLHKLMTIMINNYLT